MPPAAYGKDSIRLSPVNTGDGLQFNRVTGWLGWPGWGELPLVPPARAGPVMSGGELPQSRRLLPR
jgi:hypothetical protein